MESILLTPTSSCFIPSVSAGRACSRVCTLTGLPILGDTRLNSPTLAATIRTAQSAGCARNHVFDKASVSWDINDGYIILAGFEFPQGDINYDTTLTFIFQVNQDPDILEKALPYLSSLLRFFSGPFVDPTTFVDQMYIRLPGDYVPNGDDVDMSLFLYHFGLDLVVVFMKTSCEKALLVCLLCHTLSLGSNISCCKTR